MQPHNVSSLVTRLVNDGYFTRRPDPADRRFVQLHPTGKMRAAAQQADKSLYAGVAEALDRLPEESAQRIEKALPDLWKLTERIAPRPD